MSSLYQWFIEPWTIGDWMWRGVLTASLVSVVCAVMGCFLYLRRMSLLSDALAHVTLPGIAAAYLITGQSETWSLLLGAALAGLTTTFLIEVVAKRSRTRSDAAIGIVFTALFAIGIIMVSTLATDAHIDLDCVLYGDVLGVADHSIWALGILAALSLLLVIVFYRPLQVTTFDPALAASFGIPVALVQGALMTMLSITTVAAFEAVGAILVIAALITPAATAHLLTRHLHTMLAVAVGHGLISAILGMYISIWINCSTAGAMVVTGAALYTAAFVWIRLQRALHRRRPKMQTSAA